ncbi:MAG: energy-coupling factor ABC transporter permease [Candidatus Tectomicrobia bacterium]|uniref:Energy-coupling factor ABC transporter permease n=1 Tax=Tectimicrobiota bacterium TaxID=2528274 RepID=A0A933GM81_UNCTE|nr:energy-coupling factor ABC transporter permease [Candidatus Tectomicrobia bacterium]
MHMSDALLSPAVGTTFWVGSFVVLAHCARRLRENMDEKIIPLMGAIGAFIFAAQMINFTIPGTGSSGHLGGGLMLAIVLGPHAAFLAIASILTIQSLFFADGGILALGCNIWNLGFYPCFMAYPLIFQTIKKDHHSSTKRILIASVLSAVVGLQLGALSVVAQTLFSGQSELTFKVFASMMLPIHLAIGLVEGVITAGVVNYINRIRPEILYSSAELKPFASSISLKRLLLFFLCLSLITGGLISWFASTNPDGLEWSIAKITGKHDLPAPNTGIASELKKIQNRTALLPDYNFKAEEKRSDQKGPDKTETPWPRVEAGTSVSGLLGSLMALCLIFLLGLAIKVIRKRKT